MSAPTPPPDWEKVLHVQLLNAKPNRMFTEDQTRSVLFLHYSLAVECAECGRRGRRMWTSLLSFKAMDFRQSSFTLRSATDTIHPPLTPVCSSHPLAVAEMPPLPKKKRKKAIPK